MKFLQEVGRENGHDEDVEEGAKEEEGNDGDRVRNHVRARSVESVCALPNEDGALLEEGRNSRDAHEAEEGDREEAAKGGRSESVPSAECEGRLTRH